MGLLLTILLGGVAGWLASKVMGREYFVVIKCYNWNINNSKNAITFRAERYCFLF
jgi:hypothetical protein